MRAVRVCGRHFNGRQPSGLQRIISIFDWGMSLLLGGIKIPQQDFVLKMQEELMHKEGVGGRWYL